MPYKNFKHGFARGNQILQSNQGVDSAGWNSYC
jgi:hypothetical protein